jgi:hypothetical protein
VSLRSDIARLATCLTMAAAVTLASRPAANADGLYINEIYFNPPSSGGIEGDTTHQYIELRGVPCATLSNTFLIFVEAEAGSAGEIENVFDLSNAMLGPNGYMAIRQKFNASMPIKDYTINAKATNHRNTGSGAGFGSGAGSTIGASNATAAGVATGYLEAGGWTAMLIQTDGSDLAKPAPSQDLDVGNNGLDVPLGPNGAGGRAGWTILDSIGVFAEEDEALAGRVYSPLAYGFQPSGAVGGLEPGAQYVYLEWPELEAEYVGRWGNSTGSVPDDWHVSNLTTNSMAGFTNNGDFRQSADPHGSTNPAEWETSHGVPYGTNITNTIGGPNYPLNLLTPTPGDFDGDGDVDQADYEEQWIPRFACGDLTGSDFLDWQRNLGHTPTSTAAAAAVPEPAALWMVATGLMYAVVGRVAPRRGR